MQEHTYPEFPASDSAEWNDDSGNLARIAHNLAVIAEELSSLNDHLRHEMEVRNATRTPRIP